jgi:hypothetical protein
MWRKMLPSRSKEALVILIVALVAIVGGATVVPSVAAVAASEGCRMSGSNPQDNSSRGTVVLHAPTALMNVDYDCEGYSVNTEMWIENTSTINCLAGERSGTVCFKWGQAFALAEGGILAYGPWYGRSKHWQIQPNQNWTLTADLVTALDGGHPGGMSGDEECEGDDCPPEENPCCTPILVPLTRSQDHKLTSVAEGVTFDHNGDGVLERTAWTAADSKLAFLAIDRNGNGRIDNGTELFGDSTMQGANNGFMALGMMHKAMGGSGASVIAGDPLWDKLLLWEDANHNGVSESYELQPLGTTLSEIALGYEVHQRRDGHGNLFRYRGTVLIRTAPGRNRVANPAENKARQIHVYDVIFNVQK